MPSIETVREPCATYSNWGRWGPDDQRGTLNLITPECVVRASGLVRKGRPISLALPYDEAGPQNGAFNRFNPIHLMVRDGADAIVGSSIRDFYGGVDRHFRGTDDVVMMPLQCGTQCDALGHIVFEDRIYNGYGADQVGSWGALKNDVRNGSDGMVGRGVLLDLPRVLGVPWLEPGHAIGAAELDRAVDAAGVTVGPGDILLVRTGAIARARADGAWGDYAGGPAPGLGLAAVDWLASREVAAIATDTWGMEVRPNETEDVMQPLHIVLIVHVGMWIGEIFDLEALAADCAGDGAYGFLFCAAVHACRRVAAPPDGRQVGTEKAR